MIELLVFIAVLVALALLADRFGADSRDNFRSHETDFVALGFVREQQLPMERDIWTE